MTCFRFVGYSLLLAFLIVGYILAWAICSTGLLCTWHILNPTGFYLASDEVMRTVVPASLVLVRWLVRGVGIRLTFTLGWLCHYTAIKEGMVRQGWWRRRSRG